MKSLTLAVAACLSALTGCERSDGDRLARASWKAAQNVQALVPERTPFGRPLGLAKNATAEERIRERFRNDRYLAELQIEIFIDDNTVRLRGHVDDPALKSRALELAESTIGIEAVMDEIVVGPR